MSRSEHDFNDEKISEYLDGELTGSERDRVSQLLKSSSDHRHLYEDLVSLHDELKLLPRHSLDDDFYLRVLCKINELPPGEPKPDAISEMQPPSLEPNTLRPRWARHVVLWPLAALAATVLIAVFINGGFGPDPEVELAKAPDESTAPIVEGIVEGNAIEPDKEIAGFKKADQSPETEPADFKSGRQAEEATNIAVESVVEAMGENQVDVIVQVNLAQADIGNKAFDEFLSRNQIVYDTSTSPSHLASRPASEPAKASPKVEKGASAGYGQRITQPPSSPLSKRASQPQNHQLVYVEAPAEQIQATVKDLEKDIHQFPEVKLYLSNHLDQASLDQLGIDRASQMNIAAHNKISQMQRADQFYFLDTSRRFVQQALQPENGQTRDPISQNTERLGRAQRIVVDELRLAEGEHPLKRKAAPAYQWNARGLTERSSAEQSSPEKRSRQSFGDRPEEPQQQQSNELANAVQLGRSLQVLFLLTPNRTVQTPSAESATMEEPAPPEVPPDTAKPPTGR